MNANQIESTLTAMGVKWEKIVKNMWAVADPEGKIPRITITVEHGDKKGVDLLKFIVFVCDVPVDTGSEFYKNFLKLNFRVEHGAFAMETLTEMSFIDALEFKTTDECEFEATLRAMMDAPKMFQEKYDIDFYTLGKPQF